MVTRDQRDAVRRKFLLLRANINNPSQLTVESDAQLPVGKYWRVENGFDEPTPDERERLAKLFGVTVDQVPLVSEQPSQAIAS